MTHALLPPAALTAGAYIRKRREAAHLSLDDVVGAVHGVRPAASAVATFLWRRLDAAERDVTTLDDADLARLRHAFRFEPEIYRNLAANLPAGHMTCRECACSWTDPCVHSDGEACAWDEPDLCTACAITGSTPAPDPAPIDEVA